MKRLSGAISYFSKSKKPPKKMKRQLPLSVKSTSPVPHAESAFSSNAKQQPSFVQQTASPAPQAHKQGFPSAFNSANFQLPFAIKKQSKNYPNTNMQQSSFVTKSQSFSVAPQKQLPCMKESTQSFSVDTREQTNIHREATEPAQSACSVTREANSDVTRASHNIGRSEQITRSQQGSMAIDTRPTDSFQNMYNNSYFVRGVSTESFSKFNGYETKPIMPEFKPPESLEVTSLLEALKSEPKVTNPDFVYSKAMERLNTVKEDGILDRYILNDEEIATLCAVVLLIKTGVDLSETVEACEKKPPSKLFVLLLKSLRKLPQTRSVFYFGEANNKVPVRKKGNYLQRNFVVTSRSMRHVKESLDKESGFYKEIFRVDEGWGYDLSAFSQAGNEGEDFVSDFIIFEPWRIFLVSDIGIKKEDGTSVMLLKMTEEMLVYENEIKPGIFQHIIPTLEENPKYLKILSEMTLDKRNCKKKHCH